MRDGEVNVLCGDEIAGVGPELGSTSARPTTLLSTLHGEGMAGL